MNMYTLLITVAIARDLNNSNRCPSNECWHYRGGKCKLKQTSACFTLSCNPTRMYLSFKSDLFGISNSTAAIGRTDNCLPKFGNEWVWDIPLGKCGMKVTNVEEDDKM